MCAVIGRLIVLVCLFSVHSSLWGQTPSSRGLVFDRLTASDGLPAEYVNSITQDHDGFMWFGTRDGLTRYDGYELRRYQHKPSDPTSLPANEVHLVFSDSKGNLWVSAGELARFNFKMERFERVDSTSYGSAAENLKFVARMLEDSSGNLWLGTLGNGLFRLEFETKQLERVELHSEGKSLHTGNWIHAIAQFNADSLLIYTTGHQLFLVHAESYAARKFDLPRGDKGDIGFIFTDRHGRNWISNSRDALQEVDFSKGDILSEKRINKLQTNSFATGLRDDCYGRIWLGTPSQGLFTYDPATDKIVNYTHDSEISSSLPGNTIQHVYEDRSNNIWVATNNGIARWGRWKSPFNHYSHNSQNSNSIRDSEVTGIDQDDKGNIWISTFNAGISRFNPTSGRFRNFTVETAEIPSNWAFDILAASNGSVWIAGNLKTGLMRFEPRKGISKLYDLNIDDGQSRFINIIRILFEDRTGNVWAGTAGNGLQRFNSDLDSFQPVPFDFNGIANREIGAVLTIYQNRDSVLWLGTSSGLVKHYIVSNVSTYYNPQPSFSDKPAQLAINAICGNSDNQLWLGTERGLVLFDEKENHYQPIELGLSEESQAIYGILKDENGVLWLQLQSAMLRYDPELQETQLFNQQSGWLQRGIHINEWRHSYELLNSGEILFGGSNGFTVFHPEEIRRDTKIPPVHITGFRLLYERVDFRTNPRGNRTDNDSLLTGSILTSESLQLRHSENSFSFEFATLDYTRPEANTYRYKLEGFHDNWISSGTERTATFTNIPPGDYKFIVKGANSAGLWNNDGDEIQITILSPWWLSGWAYAAYLLLALLVVYGWRRFELNRLAMQNQLQIQELETRKLQEIDGLKSHFFANISHEFRTPLTLILGPLSDIIKRFKSKPLGVELKGIHRHAGRLLDLVNQLLDLSKLEAGAMKLRVQNGNFALFLRSLVLSFSSLADQKEISLRLDFETATAQRLDKEFFYDPDSIEKILVNLLSNALKFTPMGGSIVVQCRVSATSFLDDSQTFGKVLGALPQRIESTETGYFYLRIKDTGVGISEEHLPHVFERFYQTEEALVYGSGGSGIGLALIGELVKLHHGAIAVNSKIGDGTEFHLNFPLDTAHLKKEHIVQSNDIHIERAMDISNLLAESNPLTEQQTEQLPAMDRTIVLVIDDHPEIRTYVRNQLQETYSIIEAANGTEGLETAMDVIPDLIISDLMMPGMDGYQVCEALKTNEKTSHIPIILLTAKAGDQHKLTGLETGADAYLTKPFNANELQIRVKNLISQRREMRERYLGEGFLRPPEVSVTSVDEQFLQRLRKAMESNIPDDNFTVNVLSDALNMGVRQLQRKIKALTGKGATELMRQIRLERAKQLFDQKAGGVSDIAYDVGFNNLSYFAKCFKELFGLTPSEYLKQIADKKNK